MVISMNINDRIVHAYLNGNSIENFKNEWYFTNSTVAGQIGKNIFAAPDDSDEQKEKVREVLCHVLIGKQVPHIDEDLKNPDYRIALDALTFHEAFAHLVSYEAREIGDVDWNAPELQKVRKNSNENMRREKYACMSGMLYLAALWQKGGALALKTCLDEGYFGFAEKCSEAFS